MSTSTQSFRTRRLPRAAPAVPPQIAYVVRPLGTLDPWSLDHHPRRKRLLMALGVRRLLTGAAAIHYTAPAEQRLAEQRLPWLPRGVVAPLGIDDELFGGSSEHPITREPVLLSMGRLDPKKGIDVLIGAFHRAAGSGGLANWRLVIAGDGSPDHVATLKGLAAAGPARGRGSSFGAGSTRTIERDLLRSSRLFALPSQQENFGISLVEAMACGVPVVVSPGVNLGAELATAGAGWITERTVPHLAETLSAAMVDYEELDRRSSRARQFAERFRWSNVAVSLQSMYDEVVRSQASLVAPDLSPVTGQLRFQSCVASLARFSGMAAILPLTRRPWCER